MRPKSFFLAAGAAALCILGAAWLWLSRPAAPPASSASSGPASSAPGADSEAPAPSEPAVTVIQDTFGFAGPDGSTLLLPAQAVQPQDPQAIDTAVGAWGTLLPVTWDGTQDADSQDTGRWTAANFGHMAGQLYQVEGAAARPDGQLLLGLTWQGAEGQSALLLQQEGQALQEQEAVFYRYTSPA